MMASAIATEPRTGIGSRSVPEKGKTDIRGLQVSDFAGSAIVRYALCVMAALACNTLPALIGSRQSYLYLGIVALTTFVIALLWAFRPLNRKAARVWFAWLLVVVAVYVAVFFATGDGYGAYGACAFAFLALCPLALFMLREAGFIQRYIRAFANTMAVLAVVSLVLWLAGPVLNYVSPNCIIDNTWNGLGVNIPSQGYFHLQYITQTTDLPRLELVRNTGLYAEAPMYSFVLSVALIIECFFSEKPRLGIVLLLSACIISTLSTTGIILVMGVAVLWCANWVLESRSSFRWIVLMLLLVGFAVAAFAAVWLLDAKMGTSSGSTRADDFRAGFMAWQASPIVGYGLGDSETVKSFMSGFRSMNLGFSNSLFDVLVRGGMVFMIPVLVAIVGLLRCRGRRLIGCLLFLYLWVLTIVTFQPIAFGFFGLGVVNLMHERHVNGAGKNSFSGSGSR